MSTIAAPLKARKIPFPTVIDFTVANINNAMFQVRKHGLAQVQFCSKADRGFHLMVYPNDATFYANVSLPRKLGFHARRTMRIQVGVFGLHTIAQARAEYLDVRRMAYAGIDPKAKRKHPANTG